MSHGAKASHSCYRKAAVVKCPRYNVGETAHTKDCPEISGCYSDCTSEEKAGLLVVMDS